MHPASPIRVIAAQVSHHLLLAHGTAVPVLRANVGADAQIGIVNNQAYFDTLPGASEQDRIQRDMADALSIGSSWIRSFTGITRPP